jgi:hypothetical protein
MTQRIPFAGTGCGWGRGALFLLLALPANGATGKEPERVVELPPLVVEDTKIPPRWRYATLPGMEFLACCNDDLTLQLIETVQRMMQQLDQFVPPQLRLRLDTSVSYVLFDEKTKLQGAAEIVAGIGRDATLKPTASARNQPSIREMAVRQIPNFRFWDLDKLSVFFVMEEDLMGSGALTLTPGFVRYLLEKRTPALPGWFIEGMMVLYGTAKLEGREIRWRTLANPVRTPGVQDPSVVLGPATWISPEETRLIRKKSGAWRPRLLELPEMFNSQPPPNPEVKPMTSRREAEAERREGFVKNDGVVVLAPLVVNGGPQSSDEERRERYLLWRSQAALFLRWALDRDEPEKRAALWRFVEQASVRNVTPADFEAAFHLGYAEATTALLEYLPRATDVWSTVVLRFPQITPMPDVELREPTTAELARVKGDLERLEVGFLKEAQPQVAAHYEAQARRTLRRAYDKGVRDPELLAVMGLCECDSGNDAAARPYLEAATKAGVVRPRAYYELARITYNALRAWDGEARFSAKQTAELLQLLFTARTQSPPLPEVYQLIASVWSRSEVAPQRAHLGVLDEGVRNFPANLGLVYATAKLNVDNGFGAEADGLIDYGLRVLVEGPDRELFRQLKAQAAFKKTASPPERGGN